MPAGRKKRVYPLGTADKIFYEFSVQFADCSSRSICEETCFGRLKKLCLDTLEYDVALAELTEYFKSR